MPTKSKSTNSNKSEKKKIVCNVCGRERSVINYYKSSREEYEHIKYCTTCKECLRKSSIDTNVGTVTEESIKPALKKLDRPFIYEVFMMIKERCISNEKFLGDYLTQLNLLVKYKDCTFSDSVDIEIAQEKLMNAKVDEVKRLEVTDEMYLFWGRSEDLCNQDYIDLQKKYEMYIKNESEMDFKKQEDYKQLCKLEFSRDKISFKIDKDSVAIVKNYQSMINELSDSLGIQAIQKQDEFDSNKFVLGLITRYHEDIKKEPIRRWVEDLGQIDPLRDIIQTDYIGGLGAAMGVTNPKVEEAKKRMEKYMVKLEEHYDDSEDEE